MIKVGSEVRIPLYRDPAMVWTVEEILPLGQVTCKRTPDPKEPAWGGYLKPESTMAEEGTTVLYCQVVTVDHLEEVVHGNP